MHHHPRIGAGSQGRSWFSRLRNDLLNLQKVIATFRLSPTGIISAKMGAIARAIVLALTARMISKRQNWTTVIQNIHLNDKQ
jgi:hypothetical protein